MYKSFFITLVLCFLLKPALAVSSVEKQQVLASMNNFLRVLDNNESWNKLTPYIDFPDAGVPDCGMFIESYHSHLLMINDTRASVRVQFNVAGEFAGLNYYRYPQSIKREVTYRLVYTNRSWSVIDESEVTSYIPSFNGTSSWKVRTADIAFMNIRFIDWHMRYYSPHTTDRIKTAFPPQHCWVR
ncbi:hypothetical protein [Aquella oligotrophica]|uniref:DUF4468 domain-containing protein n=1 Tax=Aquella oligotrophica TaxID=2067065 RepID=A0A2I7N5S0_9NEIS|nr:hypothetical protein [Aquella oligotrophica]AUR51813.1 hypothetical protein CUN60_05720 [Aquella oligotrophica]